MGASGLGAGALLSSTSWMILRTSSLASAVRRLGEFPPPEAARDTDATGDDTFALTLASLVASAKGSARSKKKGPMLGPLIYSS